MFDPTTRKEFNMSTVDTTGFWYRGTPLWSTVHVNGNEKLGLKSASLFWVGGSQNCSGEGYPDWYLPFNQSYSFAKRVNTTIDLMLKGYQLIMTYFDQPDHDGHEFGPIVEVVKYINIYVYIVHFFLYHLFGLLTKTAQETQAVDWYIGDLLRQMDEHDLTSTTDLIIVADHGMASIEGVIDMNSTIFNPFDMSSGDFYVSSYSPLFAFYYTGNASDADLDTWVNMFTASVVDPLQEDLFQIWKRDDIPPAWNYNMPGYHHRIPDILAVTNIGYNFKWTDIPPSVSVCKSFSVFFDK
ncbi:ectonucleotide pyrophosphatase/phosphodiesterase [Reticulomyxa filosa]|uniref:Ectonucleotide pyrophosphatase/phosphodiesterase n=1 Tax=Reticulomyxa filosa TaxID=46433 RepID=X6MH92_RETFI|nr:ectonucleotide pyrophosphatase/phosphodiesterase [Reticulomyxa filosa]|eukprot:ETO13264.1 ectonucleotide pyrophosphatase/phosphodiesterase [Reticulomyxa filosa]